MKKDITIGELAKLMHLSTHQIRYFEEKGVLSPKYIDDNGYRMYGTHEIYKLAHILYLRELDISVNDIKHQFNSNDDSHFIDIMQQSLERITEEIKKLKKLKAKTEKHIDIGKHRNAYYNRFVIKQKPERLLYEYIKAENNYNVTARDMLDLYKNHFSDYSITLADYTHYYICSEKPGKNLTKHILPSGDYLCFLSTFSEERPIKKGINDFFRYAYKKSIKLTGKLIFIEMASFSMMHNRGIDAQIQMLIEP